MPEILESATYFEGEELRHPLLPAAQCVPNSLKLNSDLQILIISGSNMSGKSTLLRTVGVNVVLALAGAACFFAPWPAVAVVGAALLAVAAVIAVVAVVRWDRTHLAVTGSALVVEHGFLSRRSASISLQGTVFEVERTLPGRVLGYGTVVAGELEMDYVPRRLTRLLQQRR